MDPAARAFGVIRDATEQIAGRISGQPVSAERGGRDRSPRRKKTGHFKGAGKGEEPVAAEPEGSQFNTPDGIEVDMEAELADAPEGPTETSQAQLGESLLSQLGETSHISHGFSYRYMFGCGLHGKEFSLRQKNIPPAHHPLMQ